MTKYLRYERGHWLVAIFKGGLYAEVEVLQRLIDVQARHPTLR